MNYKLNLFQPKDGDYALALDILNAGGISTLNDEIKLQLERLPFKIKLKEEEHKLKDGSIVLIPTCDLDTDSLNTIKSFLEEMLPQIPNDIKNTHLILNVLLNMEERLNEVRSIISKLVSFNAIVGERRKFADDTLRYIFDVSSNTRINNINTEDIARECHTNIVNRIMPQAKLLDSAKGYDNVTLVISNKTNTISGMYSFIIEIKISNPVLNIFNHAGEHTYGYATLHGNLTLLFLLDFSEYVQAFVIAKEAGIEPMKIEGFAPKLTLLDGNWRPTARNGYHGAGRAHPFISNSRVCFSDFINDIYSKFPRSCSLLALVDTIYQWATSYYIGKTSPYNSVETCVCGSPETIDGIPFKEADNCIISRMTTKDNSSLLYCNEIKCKLSGNCKFYKTHSKEPK